MVFFNSTFLLLVFANISRAAFCGCNSCTTEVWESYATDSDGTYTCGGRVNWLQTSLGYDESSACARVSDDFIDGPCGPVCDPRKCNLPTLQPTQPPTPETTYCGCTLCTQSVWESIATDSNGSFTCGARVNWLQTVQGYDEAGACSKVSEEFNDGPCGPVCDPRTCGTTESPTPTPSGSPTKRPTTPPSLTPSLKPTAGPSQAPSNRPTNIPTIVPSRKVSNVPTTSPSKEITSSPISSSQMCSCTSCTGSILNSIAEGSSCGSRINWAIENNGLSEEDACKLVAEEYPSICGKCHSDHCGSFPPSPIPITGSKVKVMSYNTQYTGYWDGRLINFAAHISTIDADIVGLQECQDPNGIATASGYTLLTGSGAGNVVLYDSNILEALDSGNFNIPRDDYAQRNISWGRFRIIASSDELFFFNTHLPHNHNEAADPNTHAMIANMLLDKRKEFGAENSPTIVTGDCNPFASAGASEGSFEDNLAVGGIIKVYQATGVTGGFPGLDKIFASQQWTWSGASDVGTGTSDHPAITADLTLIAFTPKTSGPTKNPTPALTLAPADPSAFCGCASCTEEVWNTPAIDNAGWFTCGGRISWLRNERGLSEYDACVTVSSEFIDGPCGPACNPSLCSSSSTTTTSATSYQSSDQKCGGAVDFTNDSYQACQTYLFSPTGDSTMHCFAYGGSGDPCHLNNNNDQDDGLFKDPSLCLGDTFYLWDEPDTQGRDYSWAGLAWYEYSQRFAQELEQMRSLGTKVTGPLLKAGTSGVIEQNMQTFFDACGPSCSNPSDPGHIDVIAINGFCGPWNGDAGCRGGAKFIYDEALSVSISNNNLPVYITNWSRLQTTSAEEQVDAIESIDEFFPGDGSVVERVYWFGAMDYGGGAGTTGYLTNSLADGRTLGQVWRSKCDSLLFL